MDIIARSDKLTEEETNAIASELLAKYISVEREDGDYYKNGVLYCGKCHTPRQMDFYNNGQLVGVLCSCREEESARQRAELEKRDKLEHIEQARNAAFEAEAYKRMRFSSDDGHNAEISGLCKRYARNFSEAKKTFYAASVANAVVDAGYFVMFSSLSRLIANTQVDYGKNQSEILRRVTDCDLLVLDDFGVERLTEFALEKMFDIVNERILALKPMIVTTNLTLAQMKKPPEVKYKRICDRILSVCTPVIVTGESRRVKESERTAAALAKIIQG